MIRSSLGPAALRGRRSFWRDVRGASAVEFSMVGLPFILLLLFVIQIGLVYVYKMALDKAVLSQAELLAADFSANAIPPVRSYSYLQNNLTSLGGGFITNTSALQAEVQPLANLDSSVTPISTSQLMNEGSANTVLAIRASYVVPTFLPGVAPIMTVYSSALVRRQNL